MWGFLPVITSNLSRGSCGVYSGKGRQRTFLGLATGGFGVGTTAVGGVWVGATAVTAGGGFGGNAAAGAGFFFVGWLGLVVVASCERGGECRAGGIVAGLSYGLVVCLCLSVCF